MQTIYAVETYVESNGNTCEVFQVLIDSKKVYERDYGSETLDVKDYIQDYRDYLSSMQDFTFTIIRMQWPETLNRTKTDVAIKAHSKELAVFQVTNEYVFGSKKPENGTMQSIEFNDDVLSVEFF